MEDIDSVSPRPAFFCDADKYDYIHKVAEKILIKYVKSQNGMDISFLTVLRKNIIHRHG